MKRGEMNIYRSSTHSPVFYCYAKDGK